MQPNTVGLFIRDLIYTALQRTQKNGEIIKNRSKRINRNKTFQEKLIRLLPLHYLTKLIGLQRCDTAQNYTLQNYELQFYKEWFSVCPNIITEFCKIATFRPSNTTMTQIRLEGMPMIFCCAKLHSNNYNVS
jgi:hypothetical protein